MPSNPVRFHIVHITRYAYAASVSLCHSIAHLKPRDTATQTCNNASVRVSPWPSVIREYRDFFDNRVNYFSIQQAHVTLEIIATSDMTVHTPLITTHSPAWEYVVQQLQRSRDATTIAARLFTLPSSLLTPLPALTAIALEHFTPERPIIEATTALMHWIYTEFAYDASATTVTTPLTCVLEQQRGVCQDFAHLAIAVLRSVGLAARYVSGYLETLPPPGQIKLRGADASHAWFAVFVPGHGWIDFDPTNDCLTHRQHITTAIGRDYHDVTPVRGVFYGGGEHQLTVAVDVDRVIAQPESP